ncbi:MAG: hypothetical protein JWM88_2424 [Verrucomicrobia bacterium]|nr:hypothetical protein [Verrucomicrobiota bacterium]
MMKTHLFSPRISLSCAATLALLNLPVPAVRAAAAGEESFVAKNYEHRVIYHSPQTPGFTSWVGAWKMPDGSVMVSFTQATGPVEGRALAPVEIQRRLDWPPPGLPGYDMTGLEMRNVHLKSKDAGATWEKVSADSFKSNMNGITGEPEVALSDGTVLRAVWGHYLPYNPEKPQTGFIERSHDGTLTWGPPEVMLDPKKCITLPKRLRVLRDGRLISLGGIANVPAGSINREAMAKYIEPMLVVSSDEGHTWSAPIAVVPEANRHNWGGEEFDLAELPNGDLLCVFRLPDPSGAKPQREVRWQGVLKKQGATWVPTTVGPAPFPHSGHPELLATKEGPILHLATTGIHWTDDAGASWHRLDLPGSAYYPHAVQTDDGQILVVGHIGSDDAYGKIDQSIVMDSFRLAHR